MSPLSTGEAMDIRDFVGVLRRRWLITALFTLTGLGAAIAVTLATRPVYEATVQDFVSLRHTEKVANAYQDNLFSQARVKSYAEIVNSPAVTSQVVRQLRLPMTPRQLASRISARAPSDTVLVDITIRDTSRTRARDVANAVGSQFAKVVGKIEEPGDGRPSLVTVTVVRPAELPGAPVSPRPPLNLALGLLLGACAGLATAVLRDVLDTSVKTHEDIAALTGSGPLGVIGFDSHAKRHPIVMEADPQTTRGESFRTLRTNLRFVDVDRPPKVAVVTSCGVGDGKSTTACNLAVTMASAGVSVVLVDTDLRRPSVASYMGLEGSAGLTDVLVGRSALDEVLQPWGGLPLLVLASGALPPNPSELLGSVQMADLLAQLRSRAEFVLLDTPPLLPVTDAAVLAPQCDGVILAVRHGRTDRRELTRALDSLHNINARLLGAVLTMAPNRSSAGYGRYAASAYASAGPKNRRGRNRATPRPARRSDAEGAAFDAVKTGAVTAESSSGEPSRASDPR